MGRRHGSRSASYGSVSYDGRDEGLPASGDFEGEQDMDMRDVIPFSHFTDEDHHLFHNTMALLLTYANEVMDVVDRKRVNLCDPDERVMDAGFIVSEELWQHREVMDLFVRRNPYDLPEEQLDIVRSWEYGVHGVFTCVDADADCALYLGRDCVFAVGAMDGDADSHVHAIPSLMMLTLLPWRGGIVTDSKTMHLSQQAYPWARDELTECANLLITSGHVAMTSEDLLCYWLTHQGKNNITPRWQKQVDAFLDSLRTPAPMRREGRNVNY